MQSFLNKGVNKSERVKKPMKFIADKIKYIANVGAIPIILLLIWQILSSR